MLQLTKGLVLKMKLIQINLIYKVDTGRSTRMYTFILRSKYWIKKNLQSMCKEGDMNLLPV